MKAGRTSIQAYLGVAESWRVREKIQHELIIFPNKEDIRSAKKKDPLACAIHNAACRIFNIPNCAIGGRWAYIPQRDERGNFFIAKMQSTAATQRAIAEFDRSGKMPEGGFRFIPLAPTHHSSHIKKAHKLKRKAVKTNPKRAYVKKMKKIQLRSLPTSIQV